MDQDKRTLNFLRLFVRHEHEIYAYTLALVPHVHDADDLFQDGMIVMWRKFGQFRLGTNFQPLRPCSGVRNPPKSATRKPFASLLWNWGRL